MKLQPLLIPVLGFMSASYTQDVSVTPVTQSKALAPVIQAELGPQGQPQVEIQYASAAGPETCLPGCALDVSLPAPDNGLSAPQPELGDEAQSFADLSTASGPNFFSGDSGLSLRATSVKFQSRQNEISTAFNSSNFGRGGGRPSSGAIGSPGSNSDGSGGSGSEGQNNSDQNGSNQNSSAASNSGAGGSSGSSSGNGSGASGAGGSGTSSDNGKGGGAQGDGASGNGANGNDNGSSQDKPDNTSGEYGLPSDIPTSGQPQDNHHKPSTGDSVPASSGPQQGTSPSSDDSGNGDTGNPQGGPRNPTLPSKPGDEPGAATPGTGGGGAQPVPEPASFTLLGSGLLAGWMLRRRRGARKEA